MPSHGSVYFVSEIRRIYIDISPPFVTLSQEKDFFKMAWYYENILLSKYVMLLKSAKYFVIF